MSAPPLIACWLPPALVLASILPLGAVAPVAEHSITIVVTLTFLVAALRMRARDAGTPFADLDPAVLLVLPAVPLLQWALIRTVGFSAGPESEILHAAALTAALVAFFVICYRAIVDRRTLGVIVAGLVAIGTVEGVYAVLNLLAGNEYLLFTPRTAYETSATGTLVSRNHFALLMELLLPLTAVLAVTRDDLIAEFGVRSDGGERIAKRTLLGTCAAFQALALLLSQSRSGIAALVLATGAVGWVARRGKSRAFASATNEGRSASAVVGAGAIVALGFAALIGVEPLLDRLADTPRHLEAGRLPVWSTAARMAAERPLFGHGWGTFGALAPGYRAQPTGLAFEHAHSEYLEVTAEAGIVGLALAVWLVVAVLRRATATLALPLTERRRTAVAALATALVAVFLHSLVDFGLRVPGVAMTFVAVLAIFFRITSDPALVDGSTPPPAGGSR